MGYANINNPANYQLASFGQFGFRKISTGGSGLVNEEYRVVYALEDSSVTVVASSGDNLTAEFLLAGTASTACSHLSMLTLAASLLTLRNVRPRSTDIQTYSGGSCCCS